MKKCLIFLVSLFLMIGTMWAQTFPETSTADAPKYYTIASYNRGGYLTNVGEGRGVEHIAATKESLWYFTQADENGGVHFCNYAGGYLAADKTVSETAGVWYVLSNGVNTNGVSISSTNPISDDSCIDANSYNSGVGAWRPSANDWQGTTWVFAEVTDFSTIFNVDEAKASAKAEIDVLASVSGNYPDATEVKERIDNINAEGTSPEQYEAAIDAVNQCVADYKDAVLQALGGKYFTINTPARDNGFMKVVGNQVVGVAEASSSAAIWQFEYTDGAVRVLNPQTGKYLCEPGGYSANVAVTENAAEAGAYQLVVNQAAANDAAKVKLTSNGKSIHMGGNSVLVRWDDGGASEWTIAEVEVDITKDITELLGANADNHAETPTLGQYSTAGYTALQDALNTVTTLKQAADAVAAFEATKCLPVFTIDGVWGYALGMSIYESESGSLLWKETDRTESMLWSFDMTDTIAGVTDKVVVRNLATGNLFWGASFIKVTETSESIADDGLFLFYTEGTGNPVHAAQAGQSIVRWNNLSANSASAWRFTYAGTTYGINDLPEIPEDEVDNSIKVNAGTDGWIEGTEWFDESAAILSYTSPLYHFQDKVETFRITVNKNKGGGAFFCLSELTLYDGNGEKIALTADNIASNADHNTLNPNSPDGGGLVALLDGQTATFFHSAWSNMPAEAHYLEITLPNDGYDAFCFRMLSRAFNGGSQTHTFPGEMVVTTSVALESTETPNIPEGGYNEPIEGVVSNLSETNPAKCYTISTNGRGAWAVDAEAVRLSYVPDGNIDATDSRQQFAILSVNDEDYYLYSVSEKMFVKSDGSLDLLTGDAIEFVDASVSQGTGRVQVHFRDFANSYINVNTGQGLIINHWNTIDEGNAVLIAEAGDFDAAEALAILADPEAAALAALVAQAQDIIDVNADNHAVDPALGQYLTEAYEALVAAVNAEDKSSSSLRDAIAAFEDSKCLPVFTIDGANDYAAGMSIYDDGGQYPRWKATDRSDESMLWAFEMTDTVVGVTDKVVVKNLATGNLFMGNPPYNASYLRVAETTEDIADDGLFLMFREEDTEYAIWASQTGMVVPSQGIFSANSTSAWKFTYAGTTYRINELPEEEAPQVVISSLSAADSTKCYTISTVTRGGWAVDAAGTSFTCTTAEGLTVDESDPRQQFAILSLNAQDYYLYSVSAKKFVKRDGSLVAGMADAIEFVDASSMGAGRVMVRFDEDHIINVSDVSRRMEINNWSSLDEGNAVVIIEAGDFDATEALVMLSTPAVPDTSSVGLTNLAAADPTKCYTISTNGRGAWAVDTDGTRFSTTGVEEFDVDVADARQQFAILSANGEDYYLYSVSAKKFVKQDRSLVVGAGDAIEFVDASSFEESRVMVRFRDIASSNINIGGDNQMVINSWGTIDAGNAVLIAEAGDFDATEALAQLADPEAAALAALMAQAQVLIEANAENHAAEPALGQYATSAYDALVAAVSADEVDKESVEAAIAAFEASKCLPVFTIDGVYDYAAGMSIYESEAGTLLWRETDRTESMLWSFDMTDTIAGVTDKVVVKNLATGNYFDKAFYIQITETEENLADDGLFLIYPEGMGYPLFADLNGRLNRATNWSANSPCAWKFTYAGTTYGINKLPETPEEPDVLTEQPKVTPSSDTPVTRVDNVTLVFTKDITATMPEGGIEVVNTETMESVKLASIYENPYMAKNMVMFEFEKKMIPGLDGTEELQSLYIDTPGNYSFTIPAGCIKSVDGEVFGEHTFTFTVVGSFPMESYSPKATDRLEKIEVTFNEAIVDVVIPNGGMMVVDSYWSESSKIKDEVTISDDKKTVTLELETPITTPGQYILDLYQGVFLSEDGINESASLAFNVVDPTSGFITNYNDGDKVDEIKALEITFNNVREVKLVEDAPSVVVYMPNGSEAYGTPVLADNKITVTFEQQFTEEGEYVFQVPAGMFTMDGVANEERLLTLTLYTLTITPLEVVSVTPQEGKVGQLDRIFIQFNQQIQLSLDENLQQFSREIKMYDANGEVFTLTHNNDNYNTDYLEYIVGAQQDGTDYDSTPITAAGTYTLDISQIVVDYAAEESIDEWGYPTMIWHQEKQYCVGTYEWTIEPMSGDDDDDLSVYYMSPLPVRGKSSSVVNVPVVMENSGAVVSFQFDLYLPETVSVVSTMEDGEVIYDITLNSERAKSSHVLDCEPQADGSLRVVAFSVNDAPFEGNSGVILEVAAAIGDLEDGDYPIAVRNIRMAHADGTEEICPDFVANLTIQNRIMGDVNGDWSHTISDVVMVVNAALGRSQTNFDAVAADMNGDGMITVGDVVSVLRLVLGGDMAKASARSASRGEIVAPELDACEFSTIGEGRVVLPVALNNTEEYSAFQLDVVLPEGVELMEATLTDRARASHNMMWNTMADGRVRIVAYAMNNATFRGNEGVLLNLVFDTSNMQSGEDAIILSDALLAMANSAEHRAADLNVMMRSETTEINALQGGIRISGAEGAIVVETATAGEVSIYSLTGQMVQNISVSEGTNRIALPAGMYMVNRQKIIVK